MHAQLPLLLFERSGEEDEVLRDLRRAPCRAPTRSRWMPAQRQAEVLGTPMHAQLANICSFLGIGSGNVSSLPSLVLRSMLKQRRILMRMH